MEAQPPWVSRGWCTQTCRLVRKSARARQQPYLASHPTIALPDPGQAETSRGAYTVMDAGGTQHVVRAGSLSTTPPLRPVLDIAGGHHTQGRRVQQLKGAVPNNSTRIGSNRRTKQSSHSTREPSQRLHLGIFTFGLPALPQPQRNASIHPPATTIPTCNRLVAGSIAADASYRPASAGSTPPLRPCSKLTIPSWGPTASSAPVRS